LLNIDEIRLKVVAALEQKQAPEAQRALSRLAPILDELERLQKKNQYAGSKPNVSEDKVDPDRTYETRIASILSSLISKEPNINFANRTIANVENGLMRDSGGRFQKLIYVLTDGSPIVAVYLALSLSFMTWLVFFAIFVALRHFGYYMVPLFLYDTSREFFITVSFAFFGALVSIAFRLNLDEVDNVGVLPLFLTNLIKPYIGAIFGIVVFCFLESRIFVFPGINDATVESYNPLKPDAVTVILGNKTVAIRDYLFFYVCAVVGFISGFSERFATDLIDRSTRLFTEPKARSS
jgi:hypothetical protein